MERLTRVIPSPHLHRVLRTADGNFYNKREPQHDKYHSSWQKLEHIFSLHLMNLGLWVKDMKVPRASWQGVTGWLYTLLCFINTVIWLRIRLLGAKLPSFRTILVQNYILYASTFLSSVTGMSRGFTYQFANIKQTDQCSASHSTFCNDIAIAYWQWNGRMVHCIIIVVLSPCILESQAKTL